MVSRSASAAGRRFDFDGQAADFDRRAGLPSGAVERIAGAVVLLAELGPRDLLLELGAGTGEIGVRLAAQVPRYVGIDRSWPMLDAFRLRRPAGYLVQADADRSWPLRDGRVRAFFLSRSAHLMRREHLVAEALRVAHHGGAVLILGHVRRERDSVRAALRREMRRLLAEHGIEGRSGSRSRRRLAAALVERGGRVLEPRRAASWPVLEVAAESLAAWRAKPGLAGRPLAPEIRDRVLRRLEAWARERYGDVETARPSTEHYELEAVRLGAH